MLIIVSTILVSISLGNTLYCTNMTPTGVLPNVKLFLRRKGGFNGSFCLCTIQSNSPYGQTVRRSIYDTRGTKHPHSPILRYEQCPQLPAPWTPYTSIPSSLNYSPPHKLHILVDFKMVFPGVPLFRLLHLGPRYISAAQIVISLLCCGSKLFPTSLQYSLCSETHFIRWIHPFLCGLIVELYLQWWCTLPPVFNILVVYYFFGTLHMETPSLPPLLEWFIYFSHQNQLQPLPPVFSILVVPFVYNCTFPLILQSKLYFLVSYLITLAEVDIIPACLWFLLICG